MSIEPDYSATAGCKELLDDRKLQVCEIIAIGITKSTFNREAVASGRGPNALSPQSLIVMGLISAVMLP